MYIKNMHLYGLGPFAGFEYEFKFYEDGNPKPVVFVGPNGSGKTVLLAQLVDAIIEMQKNVYDNIVNDTAKGSPYFMILGGHNIKVGHAWSLSVLSFTDDMLYLSKAGTLPVDSPFISDLKDKYKQLKLDNSNINKKDILGPSGIDYNLTIKKLKERLKNTIHCFFPANRTEAPFWVNSNALTKSNEAFSFDVMFDSKNYKPIMCESKLDETLPWILHVFLDASYRLNHSLNENGGANFSLAGEQNIQDKISTAPTLIAIENVLSHIMQQDVFIRINSRHNQAARLYLCGKQNNVLIPSLKHLSLGQSILFNIFMTIIRYGEISSPQLSGRLDQISGIVIIDEADTHLHISLQEKVLPNLIKLFPKVQFILTTHSPFFVSGMEQTFGRNYDLITLPSGKSICSDEFSEVSEATKIFYSNYDHVNKERLELKEKLQASLKPIVITEGKSDVILLENAWGKLYNGIPMPFGIMESGINNLDETSVGRGCAEQLRRMLEYLGNLNVLNSKKLLGLFDNDTEGNGCFKGLNAKIFSAYKDDSNIREHLRNDVGVKALLLPVPEFRSSYTGKFNQRFFSIEHYFTDEIIDKHNMRGNEIINGTKFYHINKNKKVEFATKTKDFNKSDFEHFHVLFDCILQIFKVDKITLMTPSIPLVDTMTN